MAEPLSIHQRKLEKYLEGHSSPQAELLEQIERESFTLTTQGQMVSGHLQGRFLSMISHMIAPSHVLDIGTFTGYSALCLAEGLAEGGKVYTVDASREQSAKVQAYLAKSPLGGKVEQVIAPALDYIPSLSEPLDLVFIDAAKEEYQAYLDVSLPKVRKGGLLLADNVLWKGKVLDPPFDKQTQNMDAFNKYVAAHPDLEAMVLPLRDGLTLMRKK